MDKFLSQQRLLVIAPHADDETAGAGGLIWRVKQAGGTVFVMVVSVGNLDHYDNSDSHVSGGGRAKELENAMKVLEVDDFDKLCPMPMPREVMKPGGVKTYDVEETAYKEAIQEWAANKTHYMYLKSIAATDDLEWETVDMSDSSTWGNYNEELMEAGLTEAERLKLLQVYSEVQGLDQTKIDAATKNFLADPQVGTNDS